MRRAHPPHHSSNPSPRSSNSCHSPVSIGPGRRELHRPCPPSTAAARRVQFNRGMRVYYRLRHQGDAWIAESLELEAFGRGATPQTAIDDLVQYLKDRFSHVEA